MDFNIFQELNSIYEPLHKSAISICNELKRMNYSVEWGYYGFHSVKYNNEYVTEAFPIPVITVKNICEIGINLDHIFIEGKLKIEDAINFNFTLLQDYTFEVYGIEDYLNDFYNENLDMAGIPSRIMESDEKEIGIQIFLRSDTAFSDIGEIVRKYEKFNTYIL